MALNMVLVLAAGLAGAAQDPSLDTQIVTPVLGASQSAQGGAQGVGSTATSQNKVTVQFRGVKPSEVFNWLENHGVNFVVSQDDIPKETTVSVNLQDVSLDAALDALARALGGHWEKENGIRVFKKGESPFRFFSGPDVNVVQPKVLSAKGGYYVPALPGAAAKGLATPAAPGVFPPVMQGETKLISPEELEKWQKEFAKDHEAWAKDFAKSQQAWSKEFAKNQEAWAKEFSKNQGQWEKSFGPEFQKNMEAWSKDFAKNQGAWAKEFGKSQGNWDKQFGPEFQKNMEAWSKDFEKKFGPEFQEKMQKMSEEMQKKFSDPEFQKKMREEAIRGGRVYRSNGDGTYRIDRKELEQLRREAQEEAARARADGVRARAEGQRARVEGQRARAEAERARAEAARDMQRQGFRLFTSPDGRERVYTLRRGQGDGPYIVRAHGDMGSHLDIKSFLRNLTPDQRDRQRKRGYIWWDDLTREQKELLGGRPDGKFEIRYKLNDDEITIRGN